MNIVFLFWKNLNPTTGGVERVTDLLCRELKRRGHNVLYLNNTLYSINGDNYEYPATVYTFPDRREWDSPETTNNIAFYRNFLVEQHIDFAIFQEQLYFQDLISLPRTTPYTRTIAVLHSNPQYQFSHTFKSIIANCHSFKDFLHLPWELKWTYSKKNAKFKQLSAAYNNTMAHIDAFCMLSIKYLPELQHLYKGNMNKITAIANPNTYPIDYNIDLDKKKKQLIYVGRLDKQQKCVERLVIIWGRIYQDFPDWELTIIGEGPQLNELQQMAAPLSRITFAGRQKPQQYYQSASILCLTSNYEGWGMVIPESMAHGTVPILFNSYPAATEIINDGECGILVKPYSLRQYEKKLRMLMSDTAMRHKMATKAMEHVAQFSIDKVADKWEELFKKLAGSTTAEKTS